MEMYEHRLSFHVRSSLHVLFQYNCAMTVSFIMFSCRFVDLEKGLTPKMCPCFALSHLKKSVVFNLS